MAHTLDIEVETGKIGSLQQAWEDDHTEAKKERHIPQYSEYTDFIDNHENILVATQKQIHYCKLYLLRKDRAQRDPTKFCHFHNDIGHHTNECRQSKDEITNLIKLGHLQKYSRGGAWPPLLLVPALGALNAQAPPNLPQGPQLVNRWVQTMANGQHMGGISQGAPGI